MGPAALESPSLASSANALITASGIVCEVYAQCGMVSLSDDLCVSFHLGEFTVSGRRPKESINDLSDFLCPGQSLSLSYAPLRDSDPPRLIDGLPPDRLSFLDDSETSIQRRILGRVMDLRPNPIDPSEQVEWELWTKERKGRVVSVDVGRGDGWVETELGKFHFHSAACVREASSWDGEAWEINAPAFLPKKDSQVLVRTYAPLENRTELVILSLAPMPQAASLRCRAFVAAIVKKQLRLASGFGAAVGSLDALRLPRKLAARNEVRERIFQELIGAEVTAELVEALDDVEKLEDGSVIRWKITSVIPPPLPRHLRDRADVEMPTRNGGVSDALRAKQRHLRLPPSWHSQRYH